VVLFGQKIGTDREGYRNLDTEEISKRKLFSELFTYELYPFFRKPGEIRILDTAHILFLSFFGGLNSVAQDKEGILWKPLF